MIQGSNMTRSHKGMRKGISLLEMLMAIVLLGLLGTISYNYYKVYYDVAYAAKQARVYVILDQAQQLRGAHDLYTVKNGAEPVSVAVMVSDRQLLKSPDAIPEISATGWELAEPTGADYGTIDLDTNAGGVTADNDVAFVMKIDGSAVDLDKVDYCNILSNTANNTWSLTSTEADIIAMGTAASIPEDGYTDISTDFFCYSAGVAGAYNLEMVFVKRVDAL